MNVYRLLTVKELIQRMPPEAGEKLLLWHIIHDVATPIQDADIEKHPTFAKLNTKNMETPLFIAYLIIEGLEVGYLIDKGNIVRRCDNAIFFGMPAESIDAISYQPLHLYGF